MYFLYRRKLNSSAFEASTAIFFIQFHQILAHLVGMAVLRPWACLALPRGAAFVCLLFVSQAALTQSVTGWGFIPDENGQLTRDAQLRDGEYFIHALQHTSHCAH